VAAAEILAFAVLSAGLMIWRRTLTQQLSLLIGIAISIALFMAVAGPSALQPGFERYALFLLVPLIVLSAIGVDGMPAALRQGLAIVVPAGMLVLTGVMYFAPLIEHGGDAHPTFRTGAIEPKLAALDFVRTQAGTRIAIVCEDWWLYWPVRYLAAGDPRLSVSLAPDAGVPPSVANRLAPSQTAEAADVAYEIVFDGSPRWPAKAFRPAFTAVDPAGRPILHVFKRP
jgi:hypothetical protein